MPSTTHRTAFQALYTRVIALHDDIAIQSRAAKAAPPPPATFKLVREIRAEAARFLKGGKAGPLPKLPDPKAATLADLLTTLGQLRAILTSYGAATGHDRQPTEAELSFEDMRKTFLRVAEVVMIGVELGVDARMEAIRKGEDPEEAYNITHTFFYRAVLEKARRNGVEIPEVAPRLATHGHRYPPDFDD
ncbi:hypothetical protein [Pelagibacterium sp. H642]|uniref:hypothetical protein n=1 Tax=Pelagibacterium sp. H642 TaxID=1881069 RepID=UPI0028155771|nr:hypothetical protein [Pelagibacterium sp. H642]WMT89718.1 hypothetical protein NO934_13060 [Pelagibacterium sp. H642]